MIGELISRIRQKRNITKSELARRTNINVGHIAHIENEERNPSHRALKSICRALEIPYQPLMYTYDKVFNEEQRLNKMPEHISYNKILAVSSADSFMECPVDFPSACLALKVPDNSMAPRLEEGVYAFIEFNSPIEYKDIGVFEYDGKILIRRYIIRKDALVLRADNKDFDDITLTDNSEYNIIGKVLGTNTGLIF